ncbi:MAG: hypothetical protein RJQ09_15415 [Cyclobacteriaceae bacterium]
MKFATKLLFVLLIITGSLQGYSQEDDTPGKQAERKTRKMEKSGFVFEELDAAPEQLMEEMFEMQREKDDEGKSKYLILEIATKNKDQEIAKDLMEFKLPVELASKISTEILQVIETELMNSHRYWELGGHQYFIEVKQTIEEVALETALHLVPEKTIYKATREINKGHEYAVGLVFDRQRMFDLFNFQAREHEILDSIYWLTRNN